MNNPPASAERLFAEAMELPPGEGRTKFLAVRCGSDTTLLCEVESLLRAHEDAGDFLSPPSPKATVHVELPASLTHGTAVMNAAAHADAFLSGIPNPSNEQVEQFVTQLPGVLRGEARERIHAGLRVREWREHERRTPFEPEEELPRLPGYRLERKLGQGGARRGVCRAGREVEPPRRDQSASPPRRCPGAPPLA